MDRNFILAIVLSMGVLFAWDFLVAGPQREAQQAAREAAAEAQAEKEEESRKSAGLEGVLSPAAADVTVDEAVAAAPGRVEIETPNLKGSINLQGARIDDLLLTQYRETLEDDSPTIRLLSPRETEHGHYVQQGWIAGADTGQDALWTAPAGARLTPETPVTLSREAHGLVFEKKLSIDDRFMFTIEQTVRNESAEPKDVTPYGAVIQRGKPDDLKNFMILHEGPVGVIGEVLHERKYDKLRKNRNKAVIEKGGIGGWVGITNKYWLAAAIPPQDAEMKATLTNDGDEASPIFRASYSLAARSVAPGEEIALTSHMFGGAKDVDILQSYEAEPDKGGLGVHDFDKAVDWGNFFVLTRPIFYTLNFFGDLTGNFGVAILILTLIIKLILFPIANKGFESMSKMKKLQPEVEKIKTSYGDDKMKQQQAMMDLYKKEKLNPLAGCLPILIQMPIFYALYKTLFVTLEMRHEPFILWIKDLSAPDPTNIFNLFGLLPFDPTTVPVAGAFLGIGVLPLLMGIGMWFQMNLTPQQGDPVQKQIFAMMPFVFVFIFAPFAAGLVLYWFWNTVLTIAQQVVIMKKNGVDVDILGPLKDVFGKAKKSSPAPGE
ncbi:MAG: membrane protein insertase YidC [Pseudomonadota bacterium]